MQKEEKEIELASPLVIPPGYHGILPKEMQEEMYRRAWDEVFSRPEAIREFADSLGIWDKDGNLNEHYR